MAADRRWSVRLRRSHVAGLGALVLVLVAAGLAVVRSRLLSMSACFALAASALVGCGGGKNEAGVVEVRGNEYAYAMPDRIEGGVVTMEFSNTGKEPHEYGLARLAPGAALEDVLAELTDDDGEAPGPELLTDAGGVPGLSPSKTVTVTRELPEGTYLLVCGLPAPDGRSHSQHGMLRSFEIARDSGNKLPKADAVIVAGEKRFEMPELKAGRQTIELRNSANEEREFQLIGLEPGKTFKDVERWAESGFQGPAPASFPGGMRSIPPGTSVFQDLELEAGRKYMLTDEHGLEARFTVAAATGGDSAPPSDAGVGPRQQARLARAFGQLPLVFEPAARGVAFRARGEGSTLSLTAREATLALRPRHAKRAALMRMELVGARSGARLRPSRRLPGIVNEFLGSDPARWRTNIPTYARLSSASVYPGIGLVYHGRQGRLEYDFLIAPGADPAEIALRFRGQRNLRLDRQGNLVLEVSEGVLRQERPRAYQQLGARTQAVAGRFVLRGGGVVGFALGGYDHSRPLLIDPLVSYSTYLGGSGGENGNGIAVDSDGAAYLTGNTSSTDFPTANALQANDRGNGDMFVTKLAANGDALVYSTYVGGSGGDFGRGIAVGSDGSAYLSGQTDSTDFPMMGPFQSTSGGGFADAFVLKLDKAGSGLVYSSYLGGSGGDFGIGIAIDSAGSAYLSGFTSSTDFPTESPFQAANAGLSDLFVTKVNAAGSALVYSTYLGGSSSDYGDGIAVDAGGSAYVTGEGSSTDFPLESPFQAANPGGGAFVTKLSPAGSALVYSSYLGGSSYEAGREIAVDAGGSAYVTGQTFSPDFPTSNPFQAAKAGPADVFVTKVDAGGSGLVYSTYLGGAVTESGIGIAVDGVGSAYVTGNTSSTDFPTLSPFQPTYAGGSSDAFVTKLNAAGSALVYSSYLGGSTDESGQAIAVDAAGSAYLTGYTRSADFPTVNPLQAANAGGGGDAFATKVAAGAPTAAVIRSFDATRTGARVLLRWRTASEVSLLGFHVYREVGGRLTRLDRALIRARSPHGHSYSFRDRTPRVGETMYWLEEVRLDGTRVRYGPVRTTAEALGITDRTIRKETHGELPSWRARHRR